MTKNIGGELGPLNRSFFPKSNGEILSSDFVQYSRKI